METSDYELQKYQNEMDNWVCLFCEWEGEPFENEEGEKICPECGNIIIT